MRVVLLVLLAIGTAHAAPSQRVVLADPDPELLHSLQTTLAPWHLEVVVDLEVPTSTTHAQQRAEALSARFVVWRAEGDLIVYDRERGSAEHREGKDGTLDPADAAAAGLTVKTLMRLPPPGTAAIAPAASREVRLQAGLAGRWTSPGSGARVVGAALVRPWGDRGASFGLLFDAGSSIDVNDSGFRGSWSDWSLLAIASYTRGETYRLEPFLAVGLTRSHLRGSEMMDERDETASLAAGRLGVWALRDAGWWSVGLAAAVEGVLGAPTYTRLSSSNEIFAVPSVGVTVGLVIEIDLAW